MSLRELIINDITTNVPGDESRYAFYRERMVRELNPGWTDKQVRTHAKTFEVTVDVLNAMTDSELFASYQSFWWYKARQR